MSEKIRIEINLVLPAIPDTRDACVQRLSDLLESKEGIESAHLRGTSEKESGQFCIHFDPKRLSMGEVRELAIRVGAELEQRFGHLLLKAEPMHAREARSVESQASQINGVLEAAVSPGGVVRIEFDRQAANEKAIQAALQKIGVLKTKGSVRGAQT